jgi:hypothetical protein
LSQERARPTFEEPRHWKRISFDDWGKPILDLLWPFKPVAKGDFQCATIELFPQPRNTIPCGLKVGIALLDIRIESLAELSNRGRVVPELRVRGITAHRELIVSPYYRIIYRVEAAEVWIIAVLANATAIQRVVYTLIVLHRSRNADATSHVRR